MVNLHNLTKFCVNLQKSHMESMNPKKEIVSSISESLTLKNEISVQQSATNIYRVYSFDRQNRRSYAVN